MEYSFIIKSLQDFETKEIHDEKNPFYVFEKIRHHSHHATVSIFLEEKKGRTEYLLIT